MRIRMLGFIGSIVVTTVVGCQSSNSAKVGGDASQFASKHTARPTDRVAVDKVVVEKPKEGPPRTPQASTCVRFGEVKEQYGDEAKDPLGRNQHFEEARAFYNDALKVDPKHQPALLRMAKLHEKAGQYPQAVQAYNRALQVLPNDAELWHELGMCYGKQKEWQPALDCLAKAQQLQPNTSKYATDLGWMYARVGKYAESVAVFRTTVGEARAHYNVAIMTQRLGLQDVARSYAQAALRVDPNLADAKQLVAQLDTVAQVEAPGQ